MQQQDKEHNESIANENYQKELDRINKKEIAIIQATGFGKIESEDVNKNTVPDVLETSKFIHEKEQALKDYNLKLTDIQSKNKQAADKIALERDKLRVEEANQANDLAIAKLNAKNRGGKSTSKTKK